MKRVDSSLLIQLYVDRPKPNAPPGATEQHLFAQCKIDHNLASDKPAPNMEHCVVPVTDSSRYFVVRISDEKTRKEAHIGIGFRERNDALNFKMSLQDYERSMKKEALVNKSFECEDEGDDDNSLGVTPVDLGVSKLSLKDGEKIQLTIKGMSAAKPRKKKISPGSGAGGLLLKKPPPPASKLGTVKVVNTDALATNQSPPKLSMCSSTIALASSADKPDDDDDDDDQWGEFESS